MANRDRLDFCTHFSPDRSSAICFRDVRRNTRIGYKTITRLVFSFGVRSRDAGRPAKPYTSIHYSELIIQVRRTHADNAHPRRSSELGSTPMNGTCSASMLVRNFYYSSTFKFNRLWCTGFEKKKGKTLFVYDTRSCSVVKLRYPRRDDSTRSVHVINRVNTAR